MTAFTDDDLKRLKEIHADNCNLCMAHISMEEFNALLARLWASERVIARALQYKHHFHGGNCNCANCATITAWRASKGE